MIVGCYTLDLYCDNVEAGTCKRDKELRWPLFPDNFTDERDSTCRKKAREFGWRINEKTGIAICPECIAKKKKGSGL